MDHIDRVEELFKHACNVLKVKNVKLKIINRKTDKVRRLGYLNLKTRTIGLDILTPKKRQPKSLNSILRVIAHEIAHLQKKPYRQFYRGKWINRIHYPAFYKQVTRNINKFKKDKILKEFFRD